MIGLNLWYLHAVGIYSAGIYMLSAVYIVYTMVYIYDTSYTSLCSICICKLYSVWHHTTTLTLPLITLPLFAGSVWRPASRTGTASAPSAVRSSGKTTTMLCSSPSRLMPL